MHVAFNQDASCCVAGSAQGFQVYSCSPFGRFYASDDQTRLGGVGIAQMLFSTSLVAIVGNGELNSPRRLAIVNTRRTHHAIVCELTFPTAVRNLKLNRRRLVVVLDAQIYVYNIANMKLLHTLNTVINRSGVTDITPNLSLGPAAAQSSSKSSSAEDLSHDTSTDSLTSAKIRDNWLVYPAGPPTKHHLSPPKGASEAPRAPQGDVVVFDMDALAPVTVIHAHRSPVATLALNEDGTLLATTSAKGTLIRVFTVPSGTLLYELRRGSYQSRVFDLTFSLGSKLLCVSSATQTVHIYKLDAAHRVASDKTRLVQSPAGEEGIDAAGVNAGSVPNSPGNSENEGDITARSADLGRSSLRNDVGKESSPSDGPPEPHTKKKRWFSTKWVNPALKQKNQMRDFAWFKLPLKQGTRTKLGIAPLSNIIYVATETGILFHYAIDMDRGGECRKIGEYQMD